MAEVSDSVAGQSTDQYPVEKVSWLDAVKFCNKLGEMEGRPPFYEIEGENVRVPDWSRPGYRLPTEAEWEYACRANAPTVTRYSFGDDAASLGEFGWYGGNSGHKTPSGGREAAERRSACSTCTATCASGAGTGMARAIIRSLARTILWGLMGPRPGCSGAGAGTAARGTRGRQTASALGPAGWLNRLGFRLALGQSGR